MIDIALNIWNVLLIVVGFGLVIVIHELGHFAAARWAGIRCHAFAVGFGGAIVSWRRGLGLRRGSSEPIYRKMLTNAGGDPAALPAISPTEYRLNWIPFGGYVKMLGQEDIDPAARSDAPDSFQSARVWKRMIVISAGVIANVILAAILFMIVFANGLREPAAIIGEVIPGSPAARAGLMPGDVVTAVDGKPMTFSDLRIAAAMSGKGESLALTIDRKGEKISLEVVPEKKDGIPGIGVTPLTSLTITDDVHRASDRQQLTTLLAGIRLDGTTSGDRIISAGGRTLPEHSLADGSVYTSLIDLESVIDASGGAPTEVVLEPASGEGPAIRRTVQPVVELQAAAVGVGRDRHRVEHLLGLVPVMGVASVEPRAARHGLRAGDVFARLGEVAWPGIADGVAAIKSRRGGSIEAEVRRDGSIVPLTLNVDQEGRVGFVTSATHQMNIVARTPESLESIGWNDDELVAALPARTLIPALVPGSSIVAVNGEATTAFTDIVLALQRATTAGTAADVVLHVRLPGRADAAPVTEHRTWSLSKTDTAALHELRWEVPGLDSTVLGYVETTVKASSPIEALVMGFHRTKRVVLMTYLTFKRLFEGQLEVNQLRGPVGIAHTGFYFAERGLIWVLFFLAMVSANLAVVNFLPLPIADGGQFLLLCWEGIRGKPAPAAVQNFIALAGLVLIVGLFLFITFHDVARLLG